MIRIGVYKIENIINKKIYIGQSKNIYKRWYSHRSDYKNKDYPIYQAMRKYGIKNFIFSIIEECSIENLSDREDYWISYYNSYVPNGYNIAKAETHWTNRTIPEKYCNIIKDILESNISLKDIAKKYGLSEIQISRINNGKAWRLDNLDYPLRKRGQLNYNIIKDMINSGLSMSEVSESLNTTVATIKGVLKKESIKVSDLRGVFTSNIRINMLDNSNSLLRSFSSAKEAGIFLKEYLKEGFDEKSYQTAILRHVKNKKLYKGFFWEEE